MNSRELIILIGLCAVWGLHFVVIKVGVAEIPPLYYAAIRMTLVAALLAPFLRWRRAMMLRVFGAGLCMGALNYAFMFKGVQYATASTGSVAIQLFLPFATILSVVFLKDKVGWRRFTGITLAFIGVSVIAFAKPDTADPEARIALGVSLIAMGALLEAFGAIIIKKLDGFSPFGLLAWFAVIGAIGLWILTFTFEEGQGEALARADRTVVISAILYSAIGGSIIGHSTYYWLLQRLPVTIVAASLPLTMVFGVFGGVLILGDDVNVGLVVGSLLTFLGVGVVVLRNAEKQDIKAPSVEPEVRP